MKLSWSKRLFFSINTTVGKDKTRDKVMVFFGHYLIFLTCFFVALWLGNFLLQGNIAQFWYSTVFLAFAGISGVGLNWIIGFLFPHPRPIIDFPEKVKQLITPLGTWKTFPSDHATVSFVMAFSLFFLPASVWVVVSFFLLALGISFGRVYVGVHYPKDILGGMVVALLASILALYFAEQVIHFLF